MIFCLFHSHALTKEHKNPMTSASSMNHEIVKKSKKNQSKQRADNGDVLRHIKHRSQEQTFNTLRPFIPSSHQSTAFLTISSTSRRSFWFYVLSSVVLAICCLPTIVSESITQPLPLWVSLSFHLLDSHWISVHFLDECKVQSYVTMSESKKADKKLLSE